MSNAIGEIHYNVEVGQISIDRAIKAIEMLLKKYPVDIDSDVIDLEVVYQDDLNCFLAANVGRKLIDDIESKYNIELVECTDCDSMAREFVGVSSDEE